MYHIFNDSPYLFIKGKKKIQGKGNKQAYINKSREKIPHLLP